MELEHPFLIQPLNPFSARISELVVMMSYARRTTLAAVRDLTQEQLDARPEGLQNSIGTLLEHAAAVETVYWFYTVKERNLTEEERAPWLAGLNLGELGQEKIKGNHLSYYTDKLAAVRAKTLASFAELSDDWLYKQSPFWKDESANNYFKWFHVFEDEINHRGQIRLIKRLLAQ